MRKWTKFAGEGLCPSAPAAHSPRHISGNLKDKTRGRADHGA